MSSIRIGTVIALRRQELGLSQEDLADGICSVTTLSRVENGGQLPHKNHLETLLERLGYSTFIADNYVDNQTMRIHELKFATQLNHINKDDQKAAEYLRELESLVTNHTSLDWQFVLFHRALIYRDRMTPEVQLAELEQALALSSPRYTINSLPTVMSYREISILNSIACLLGQQGHRDDAITILKHICAYYDSHIIVPEEALRTQPMVLYNLSKFLGLSGRYDECIEVCDLGIRIARQTGRCASLAKTLYNRGWALLHRGRETDQEQAELSLRQAYYQAVAMERQSDAVAIKKYYTQEFGDKQL